MGAPVRLGRLAGVAIALIAYAAAPSRAASANHTAAGMYATGGRALPVLSTSVDVKVDGPFAEATVTQRFKNPLDQAIEAVYIFPLPDDAAVSSMVIHAGSETITARIEDREAARARYEAAVAAGTTGALLEQERADVFTQQVTAIPAGAEVSVELRFDTAAARIGGAWQLALPLVVGPRAAPGAPTGKPSAGTGGSPDTDRAPDASRVTPEAGPDGVPVAVHAAIDAGAAIEAVEVPSHDAVVELHGRHADVAVRDARGDRELVIRWRTKGDSLAAITDAAGYVAVIVPAPAAAAGGARDWIVVADTSKRTAGDDLVLVRRAVGALAEQAAAGDRIAIYGATGARELALGPAAKARAWADAAAADGSGDLAKGLGAARAAARRSRHAAIVLVTDGLVADDAELEQLAAGGPPIFAIGVGAAPNRGLLDALTAKTGGAARYLAAADDPGPVATALYAQAVAPRAPSTQLQWGDLVADALPATLPPLAPGDAAIVIAKIDRPGKARVALDARALDLPAVWTHVPERADAVAKASVLARRWARAKVDALLAAGAPDADVRALGLRYGLVTPQTALVAVGTDTVVKGGVKTSVSIPVALPAGMKWQAVEDLARKVEQPTADTTKETAKKPAENDQDRRQTTTTTTVTTGTTPTGGTVSGTVYPGAGQGGRGGEGRTDRGETEPRQNAPSAPPPEVAAEAARDYADEEVVLAGGEVTLASRRWSIALTLGGGVLVQPTHEGLGLASLRLQRGLTARLGYGIDLTALAAPGADRDRLAGALMGALFGGGFLDGRLTFDLGLGPEVSSDLGLGYEVGARFGHRVGFVLRWDGALLFGSDKTVTRGSATAGFQLDF
jgi:Ca-activated chloride channel family protein